MALPDRHLSTVNCEHEDEIISTMVACNGHVRGASVDNATHVTCGTGAVSASPRAMPGEGALEQACVPRKPVEIGSRAQDFFRFHLKSGRNRPKTVMKPPGLATLHPGGGVKAEAIRARQLRIAFQFVLFFYLTSVLKLARGAVEGAR